MKRFTLFFICVCIIALSVQAQLSVSSTGHVTMGKKAAVSGAQIADSIGFHVALPSTSNSRDFGVYAAYETGIGVYQSGCHVGLMGQIRPINASPASLNNRPTIYTPFRAGVVGLANFGCGVYGATGTTLPNKWYEGNFSGYFAGNVKVTGTMSVPTLYTTSDIRRKENITNVNESLNLLSALHPIAYTFKNDRSIYLEDAEVSRVHYGLIAQEVSNILPNIVKEDETGILSINYIEMIPLLIQAVKQQQTLIDELQQIVSESTSDNNRKKTPQETKPSAKLYQNTPNPFIQNTAIKYFLPNGTHEASIHIYNMNGTEFVAFSIETFGLGELTIDGGTFRAGMYLYSLIADGQLVDTKQMILTK